jgi:hypothetical protein
MKACEMTVRLTATLVLIFCLAFAAESAKGQAATTTINYSDFSSTNGLRLNGTATVVGGNVLRLTPSSSQTTGTTWYATSLSLQNGFTTTFTFKITSPGGIPGPDGKFGADGIAFVIQNGSFPDGTSGSLAVDQNAAGGGIGFQGLTHSLAVEFDTFQNGPGFPNGDISSNAVSIQSCLTAANTPNHASCVIAAQVDPSQPPFSPAINLKDGGTHTVMITYVPPCDCPSPTGLSVMLDGKTVFSSVSFNVAGLGLDPSQDAFLGFTAATGDGFENHDILSWSFTAEINQKTGTPFNANPVQTFTFNPPGNNTEDVYTADYSHGTSLTNPDATPLISSLQITPADWPTWVNGTPFATTSCIPTNGANGNCVSKKQLCTTPTNATPAGDNCPVSSDKNIILSATFDAPTFPDGTVFGVAEGNDTWTGGVCSFVLGSAEGPLSCPQNGLVSFTGPGEYTGSRGTKSTNSVYVWYTGLRAPSTQVSGFVNAAGWTNTATPKGNFTGTPPTPPNPNSNNMVVAPIASITYGVNDANQLPPSTVLPVPGDTTLTNPTPLNNTPGCPNPIPAQPPLPSSFTTAQVTLGPFADGSSNRLHYFTTDCADTEDLKFTKNLLTGIWSTNFNSININVDLTAPKISGPTLSPASTTNNGVANSYLLGQSVTASYSCSDPLPIGGGLASGVAMCGSNNTNGVQTTPTFTSPVPTSTVGNSLNFTVNAADVAGNTATSSAPYKVVDQPVNLDLFSITPPRVKPGANLTYFIVALNLAAKNVATGVTLTDIAPPGTTVVSAVFDKVSCFFGGCSIPKKGTLCGISGTTVTCNIGTLAPLNTFTGVGILITVHVPANTPVNSVLTDNATATSLNRDSDGKDNSITINTTVKN